VRFRIAAAATSLALASVGFMVGCVGVVATVMISVTKRTREIRVPAFGSVIAALIAASLTEIRLALCPTKKAARLDPVEALR